MEEVLRHEILGMELLFRTKPPDTIFFLLIYCMAAWLHQIIISPVAIFKMVIS